MRINKNRRKKEIKLFEHNLIQKKRRSFRSIPYFSYILNFFLTISFLKKKGYCNIFKFNTPLIRIKPDNLPDKLNGIKILFLSDIHIDSAPDFTDKIIEKVKGLNYDLIILGGDFWLKNKGRTDIYKEELIKLINFLTSVTKVYSVLGNHDFFTTAELLDKHGVEMILNENRMVVFNEVAFYISGVDDEYFYEAADLKAAEKNIPRKSFKIMVSHSPEIYKIVEKYGYDLFLTGHTHGGQICLPGRIPVFKGASIPRKFVNGKWTYKKMIGYTSPGVGISMSPVRFFCPPELTILELTK